MDKRHCDRCNDEIPPEVDYTDEAGEDLCEDCWHEAYNRYDDGERAAERRQMGLCDF